MSGQDKYLLLDVGNTRTKYAVCSNRTLSKIHVVDDKTDLQQLLSDKKKVLLSAVRREPVIDQINALAANMGIDVQEVKTEPKTFDLRCGYEIYPKLGVDRWLSVLALHQQGIDTYAVIDIGTACTCDFVQGNQHLGGWIAPGYDLMRSSLVSNTHQVTADTDYPDSLLIGETTESCVNHGCLAYIQGMLLTAEQKLKSLSDDYRIFIDGGSQALLKSIENKNVQLSPNLVFKGLMRYIT